MLLGDNGAIGSIAQVGSLSRRMVGSDTEEPSEDGAYRLRRWRANDFPKVPLALIGAFEDTSLVGDIEYGSRSLEALLRTTNTELPVVDRILPSHDEGYA